MTTFLKAILAIFLAIPLAAQSPMIVSRIEQGNSGYLLHVGENKGALYDGLQELLGANELVEMGIVFGSIQTTSNDYAQLANELRLSPNSLWALTDSKGRCLLQGNKIPTAKILRDALDEAGVKSPIRILRDFLKRHPDHLDARFHLLPLLRKIAEERTRHVLQLDIKTTSELIRQEDIEGLYRQAGGSITIDTSSLEGKVLNPEQDIQIWGPYAQELHTLFTSGDWRLSPCWRILQSSIYPKAEAHFDVCSPTMVQLYRRHLPKVEAQLEEHPSDEVFWEIYKWMSSISKQGSVRALLNRLIPLSINMSYRPWPPANALQQLISEERANENWDFIATTLWSKWPTKRLMLRTRIERLLRWHKELNAPEVKGDIEVLWRDYIEPLLQSLIKTNRIEDAEAIILDVAKLSAYRNFQRRAAELARRCERSDLYAKWSALQIPIKSETPDLDDLDAKIYFESTFYSRSQIGLIIVNSEESDRDFIYKQEEHDLMPEWNLGKIFLDSKLSELLIEREGWQKNKKYWALFDTIERKIFSHGPELPTKKIIEETLEQSKLEPPIEIYRRFSSEHPTHTEAKELLFEESSQITFKKLWRKFGAELNNPTTQLQLQTDESYQTIFEEHATLFQQLIPYYMEHYRPMHLGFSSIGVFPLQTIQKLRPLAPSLLSQAEAALRRQPTDDFMWHVWFAMSDSAKNRPFRDFKETLVLSPMSDPLELPPQPPRHLMMYRCLSESDWQTIIDIHEWRWEAIREKLELNTAKLTDYSWHDDMMTFLLKAYLHLEKDSKANDFIKVWRQSLEWEKIKHDAIAIAKDAGRETIAEQWEKF